MSELCSFRANVLSTPYHGQTRTSGVPESSYTIYDQKFINHFVDFVTKLDGKMFIEFCDMSEIEKLRFGSFRGPMDFLTNVITHVSLKFKVMMQ